MATTRHSAEDEDRPREYTDVHIRHVLSEPESMEQEDMGGISWQRSNFAAG